MIPNLPPNQIATPSRPLPLRLHHLSHPQLEALDDSELERLARCGYTAIYLQDSPFDGYTGNVAQFHRSFHLISLYDIARSFDRARIQDYIHHVAARASSHGLRTFLQCHEPRLPYYAWSATPPDWRGHGGWPHQGSSAIALCWSVPEAVAYWKQMASDAMALLPEITGVTLAFFDNEAVPCDERCPRCRGQKIQQMGLDVVSTLVEAGSGRPGFTVGIVDWWIPPDFIAALQKVLPERSYIIGHSCKGLKQEIDGTPVPGEIGDMTMVSSRSADLFVEKKAYYKGLGLGYLDRTVWSHPGETWFLPAPPDPLHAIEKLNALVEAGVDGWQDFDCGSLEPGSISDAVELWTRSPGETPNELRREVLERIWGDRLKEVLRAYRLYHGSKALFPAAYEDPEAPMFAARNLGLGLALVGPFHLEDFTYFDTRHAFNFFAPFNLVTQSSVQYLLPHLSRTAKLMRRAFTLAEEVPAMTPAQQRERDAFEIHYRHYAAIASYFSLARVKLDWLSGRTDDAGYEASVRRLAASEMRNHEGVEMWAARNPGGLHNPCHNLRGVLKECWPECDFTEDLLLPKRRSLERLISYRVGPPGAGAAARVGKDAEAVLVDHDP